MQKLLLAATAMASAITLGPITIQKVEAAITAPVLAQDSTSILPVGEYRDIDEIIWPLRRHHPGNDFDHRYGYRAMASIGWATEIVGCVVEHRGRAGTPTFDTRPCQGREMC